MAHCKRIVQAMVVPTIAYFFCPDHRLFCFIIIQAGNFGADAYHSIRQRGFRVLSTPVRQSVIVEHVFSAFSIQLFSRNESNDPTGARTGGLPPEDSHLAGRAA